MVAQGGSLLVLTGSNTYSGPTAVNGGTLQIGNGTSGEGLASPVSLANGATMAFNHADSLLYNGTISGSGQLLKSGGGALTLVAGQSYSGATTVANGTLRLAGASIANGNFAAPPAVAPGSFVTYTNGALPGTDLPPASFGWAITGIIRPYNGAQGWTGVTAPPGGGQACILEGEGPGYYASISQTVSFPTAGAYPLAWSAEGSTAYGQSVNPIEVLLDGSVLTTITPPGETWTNYTTTLNVTAGPHTIEFYGTVPSDQCVTALDNISLPIGSLPATTVLTVAGQSTGGGPSGTFDLGGLSQTVAGISGGTVSGGGTTYGTITNNGAAEAVLTVTGTSQFDGVLSDGAGKLDLTVSGGSLTLTASNTYTGPTTINAGTLQIGNGGTGGYVASQTVSLSNNGTLAFNHSNALTYGGAIGGNGQLLVQGGNLLVLTGSNTYSGPTTVNGGTLQIGNGTSGEGLLSPVSLANGATMAFNHADSLFYFGTISGSGQLLKTGSGALTLGGSQTYSGEQPSPTAHCSWPAPRSPTATLQQPRPSRRAASSPTRTARCPARTFRRRVSGGPSRASSARITAPRGGPASLPPRAVDRRASSRARDPAIMPRSARPSVSPRPAPIRSRGPPRGAPLTASRSTRSKSSWTAAC